MENMQVCITSKKCGKIQKFPVSNFYYGLIYMEIEVSEIYRNTLFFHG